MNPVSATAVATSNSDLPPAVTSSAIATAIGVATVDGNGLVVGCNSALDRMVLHERASIVGSHFTEILCGGSAAMQRRLHAELCAGVLEAFQTEEWYLDRAGERQWGRMTVWAERTPDPVATRATVLLENITARRRTAQRLAAQQAVARILAEAASLAEASSKILQAICESLEWDVGSLWIVSHDKDLLRFVEAWTAPGVTAPAFLEMSLAMRVTRGVGLPGLAWDRAVPIWIEDLTNAGPIFIRGRVAAAEGLHGAIAFPIMLGNEVLGVMDFCSRDVRRRDADVLRMLATFGSQIGQFVERKRVEEALRSNERQLQAIIDNTAALIYVTDPNGQIILANRSMEELVGERGGVRGRLLYDLFPKTVAQTLREQTSRALDPGHAECEELLPCGSIERTYVSQRFSLRNADGVPYAVACVSTDITERKQDEDDLHTLATQLSMAEDSERRRLARDIHDSIGQTLSLLKIDLEQLASGRRHVTESCASAIRLVDKIIGETRTLIFDLYPAMLDDLGLVPTLQSHAEQFSVRHGLSVSISESGVRGTLTTAAGTYVFRAVKELLNNIVKHARATAALVALHWQPQMLRISVTDDGAGFVPEVALTPRLRRGLGLADIRERVRALGGTLMIESSPDGGGSRVVLDIPLEEGS